MRGAVPVPPGTAIVGLCGHDWQAGGRRVGGGGGPGGVWGGSVGDAAQGDLVAGEGGGGKGPGSARSWGRGAPPPPPPPRSRLESPGDVSPLQVSLASGGVRVGRTEANFVLLNYCLRAAELCFDSAGGWGE